MKIRQNLQKPAKLQFQKDTTYKNTHNDKKISNDTVTKLII